MVVAPNGDVFVNLRSSRRGPLASIPAGQVRLRDTNGDGRADIAIFRPSTGVWYMLRSTAGFAAMQFGISTDIPTPNVYIN